MKKRIGRLQAYLAIGLDEQAVLLFEGYCDVKADPWDIEDAIYFSAKYLATNGATKGDFRQAIFAYIKADWYVEEVLGNEDQYVNG